MNAKSIKLGLFALASASMLASCGGQTMSRADAEKELDAIAAKTITATKLTYSDGWDKTVNNTCVVDKDGLYAYRKINTAVKVTTDNVETTLIKAGSEAFAYQDGTSYVIGFSDGETKQYITSTKDTVTTLVGTFLTAADKYANGASGQAAGTSKWLKGFDKTEAATGKKELTKDDLNSLSTDCTVKGYISKETYTKKADGEFTADITAMYPYQQSLMDQGGENCIYEFKNYQLTRLYNNYQKYEEKFDWTNANTSVKMEGYTAVANTDLVTAASVVASATILFAYLAHGWSD